MTIYTGSRYEYSDIDFFSIEIDGPENPVVFYDFPDVGLINYTQHVFIQGERLDTLSEEYFNRPGLWWKIMNANPEIDNPFDIKPGTVLRIPNV